MTDAGLAPSAAMITLPERLTMGEASATLARLAPQLAAAAEPVLDAAPLKLLDTAALAVLLACQRQALGQGRTLRVTGAPPKLRQLAQLYGVDSLLGV